MRYLILLLAVVSYSTSHAQKVIRYDFGKPATVVGYIKEVIVWEDGVKTGAESFAGDKNEIYLSDSIIKISEVKDKIEYIVKETRVDDFYNVTFFAEDETVVTWFRKRRLVRVEPKGKNIEIIYYIE